MASSLQAQLATLNGTAGKHPGSTFATNRRQAEAVGRGIDFDVQKGQAVYRRDDLRFRATILYENPKQAADVPLSALEENCQEALASLAEIWPSLASTGAVLCAAEDASHQYIQRLLVRITILLGENDTQVTQSCLHLMEYLLRRYEIHRNLMEDMVWTFLPYHQQLTNIWHRCLLLVDLASHPSYLWLRPYADPNRPAPTPRPLVAQRLTQEIPLLRRLVRLVRQTATEPAVEVEDPTTPLRGWSHIFSWTATYLVDGLVWLQTQPAHVDREGLARVLVPAVRAALQQQSAAEDYTSWGCVVASTMTECLDLSATVLAQWGTALLGNPSIEPATAWSALASLLLAGQDANRVEEESYLPLLPNQPRQQQEQQNQWVGCPLPAKLFAAMTPDCSVALGNLYRELEVTPLVVAVLVRAIRSNQSDTAIALLEEADLANLWNSLNLVPSLAAYIVRMVSEDSVEFKTGRVVLQSLCDRFGSSPCEKGVASVASLVGREKLEPLIDGVVTLVPAGSNGDADVLPPRVALEHPDVEVRRKALAKIKNDRESGVGSDDMDDGETLMETLVRRWSVEPDNSLALELAQVLVDHELPLITANGSEEQCREVLIGAYHWMSTESKMKKYLFRIVDRARQEASDVGECGSQFQLVREAAICLVGCHDPAENTQVRAALVDPGFLGNLVRNFGSSNGPHSEREHATRNACGWTLLAALADKTNGDKSLASTYVQICVHVLRSQTSLDKSHRKIAERSLSQISSLLSDSPNQLVDTLAILANLDGNEVATVIAPTLQGLSSSVRNPDGGKVSSLAVLMEAATRSGTSFSATKRLLRLARNIAEESSGSEWVGLVPSLSLLSHPDKDVRECVVRLISSISTSHGRRGSGKSGNIEALSICEFISKEAGSIVQVGTSLARLLARCMEQLESEKASLSLLRLTANAIFTTSKLVCNPQIEKFEAFSWLPLDSQTGTREAGCSVLEAMEVAGEDAFPLVNRWECAGKWMMEWLVSEKQRADQPEHHTIVHVVARMLKGVTVSKPQIVISSGPDQGGARSRSYSVGNFEGAGIIRPYPDDMIASIIKGIENLVYSRSVIFDVVLCSTSWSGFVFPSLESCDRKRIVQSLLQIGSAGDTASIVAVTTYLPLHANEVADIVGQAQVSEDEFPYLAILADYVKASAGRLVEKERTDIVIAKLFGSVHGLSNLDEGCDQDGIEYLLQSFLKAIRDMFGEKPVDMPGDLIFSWVDLILSLVGAPREPSLAMVHRLKTWRGRAVCLSILTSIAVIDPEAVVKSVADLTIQFVSAPDASSGVEEKRSLLLISVPLLWSNVLSTSENFVSFLESLLGIIVRKDVDVRNILMRELIRALCGTTGVDEEYRSLAPGLLTAVLIAMKSEILSPVELKDLVVLIFESSPVISQIMSLPFLVALSRQVLGQLLGSHDTGRSSKYLPSTSDIMELIHSHHRDLSEHTAAFGFISGALSAVSECAILENVQQSIRKKNASVAASTLQLWQNLLLIHATADAATSSANEATAAEAAQWRTVATLAEECRETVQTNMPSSVFISAVRSLLKENVTDDMRSRALRLASDCVLGVDPGSQDRLTFVEFMFDAIELARRQSEDVRVRQCALVYIEHTVRSLIRPISEGKHDNSSSQKLMNALSMCSDVAKNISENENMQELSVAKWHLLTSVALACTTIIRTVGIRALPRLAALLRSFIGILSHVNGRQKMSKLDDDCNSFRSLVQIAVLRLILSAAQTAPQSVFAQLPPLLSGSGVFSDSIRASEDPSVRLAVESLDETFAASIPARLLIPGHVRLICGSTNPKSMIHMFEALSRSVERLGTTEGGLYRVGITKAVLYSLDTKCTQEEQQRLIERTNECILGLVLKLSEVQFRKLYGELCEWMRQAPLERKYPFWSLSEVLSKELKSIFLPCASLVFDDIVKDLGTIAEGLLKCDAVEIIQGGKKRRKKSDDARFTVSWKEASPACLVPLLSTVKSVLRADAQDGGKWTRDHGRYQNLLEPLSKLIKCHIPTDLPVPDSSDSPYEYVVEENPRGSVVECLTALALASGDEQMWKPLNHAVLDACGNSGRSEVRKAGVVCLLSLIRTLGEEYMVLLPECLPVLSELLEDENEVVTGLARDAVATAEDLLGESLEENLR